MRARAIDWTVLAFCAVSSAGAQEFDAQGRLLVPRPDTGQSTGAIFGPILTQRIYRGLDPFSYDFDTEWQPDGCFGLKCPSPHVKVSCQYVTVSLSVIGPMNYEAEVVAQKCLDEAGVTGLVAGVGAGIASVGSGGAFAAPAFTAAWTTFVTDFKQCLINRAPRLNLEPKIDQDAERSDSCPRL